MSYHDHHVILAQFSVLWEAHPLEFDFSSFYEQILPIVFDIKPLRNLFYQFIWQILKSSLEHKSLYQKHIPDDGIPVSRLLLAAGRHPTIEGTG